MKDIVSVGPTLVKSYSSSFDTFPAHCTCKTPCLNYHTGVTTCGIAENRSFHRPPFIPGPKTAAETQRSDGNGRKSQAQTSLLFHNLDALCCDESAVNKALFECSAARVQRGRATGCTVWTGSSKSGVYIFKVAL